MARISKLSPTRIVRKIEPEIKRSGLNIRKVEEKIEVVDQDKKLFINDIALEYKEFSFVEHDKFYQADMQVFDTADADLHNLISFMKKNDLGHLRFKVMFKDKELESFKIDNLNDFKYEYILVPAAMRTLFTIKITIKK